MKYCFLLAMLALCNFKAAAQPRTDTAHNPLRADIKHSGIALRAGLGVQDNFCYEIGLARNSFLGSPHGMYGSSIFAAFASFPAFGRQEQTASGIRAGFDLYGGGFFYGLEVSSFCTGREQDVLIAPKIGLGIPELSAFYAYHFSTNEWAVGRIGKHAVGLQISPYPLVLETQSALVSKPDLASLASGQVGP